MLNYASHELFITIVDHSWWHYVSPLLIIIEHHQLLLSVTIVSMVTYSRLESHVVTRLPRGE